MVSSEKIEASFTTGAYISLLFRPETCGKPLATRQGFGDLTKPEERVASVSLDSHSLVSEFFPPAREKSFHLELIPCADNSASIPSHQKSASLLITA